MIKKTIWHNASPYCLVMCPYNIQSASPKICSKKPKKYSLAAMYKAARVETKDDSDSSGLSRMYWTIPLIHIIVAALLL